jgi:hypothetical protein
MGTYNFFFLFFLLDFLGFGMVKSIISFDFVSSWPMSEEIESRSISIGIWLDDGPPFEIRGLGLGAEDDDGVRSDLLGVGRRAVNGLGLEVEAEDEGLDSAAVIESPAWTTLFAEAAWFCLDVESISEEVDMVDGRGTPLNSDPLTSARKSKYQGYEVRKSSIQVSDAQALRPDTSERTS